MRRGEGSLIYATRVGVEAAGVSAVTGVRESQRR